MLDIRYSLEKYKGRSTRYFCPNCNNRTFTRYVDSHTGKHLAENTGRCNRVEKCGYHFSPKMYFDKNGVVPDDKNVFVKRPNPVSKPPSYLDKRLLTETLTNYHQNNFAIGLSRYFSWELVVEVLKKYYVGTAKGNKTIFWQVNRNGQVRAGKVMQYNRDTLKREGYINWVHRILNLNDFNLKQVFFGSHLLVDTTIPVAIAEGEKNAIFGALYYLQYNWIAVGSFEMLNPKKLGAFKGYKVTLFPDKGKAFEKWSKIADDVCFDVKVNTVLENTSLKEGDDIADLIVHLKQDNYRVSPQGILDKLIVKNPLISALIETFDLILLF